MIFITQVWISVSVNAVIPIIIISLGLTGYFEPNYEGLESHTYYKFPLSMLKPLKACCFVNSEAF